jgi:hypothetical protein
LERKKKQMPKATESVLPTFERPAISSTLFEPEARMLISGPTPKTETTDILDLPLFQNAELLDRLAKLANCIRIDPHSGDLILQRGESRLILKENGVVRIQARSIVQVAEEDITLYSAYIDLN